MSCIFCEIASGESPSYRIYEDDKIIALLDISPRSPGHTLIIPKEHTFDLTTISEETACHIIKKAKELAPTIVEKLGAEGFTIMQNNGVAAEIGHYHLHIIPKYNRKRKMDIKTVYEKITH